jgi:hypothetical protein
LQRQLRTRSRHLTTRHGAPRAAAPWDSPALAPPRGGAFFCAMGAAVSVGAFTTFAVWAQLPAPNPTRDQRMRDISLRMRSTSSCDQVISVP